MTVPVPWWQSAVIYQIYPRSFQDSDGDGIGDLPGIQARLDHLVDLGIDAVWISPIYPSPMADFGYDVSDYCGIHPLFGTMADFDRLLGAIHAKGMRLILDLVPNHTSDQHPWFQESRSSRHNPKRDWYVWRDPAPNGGPPNNWMSQSGGGAWEYDEPSGQYYYHAFLTQQPDLNWRNPRVREAIWDVLRFWLDKGVDGFRVDVIYHLMKDPDFQDDPPNPMFKQGDPSFRSVRALHSIDHADLQEVVAEMRRVLNGYPGDRLLIGEIYLPLQRLVAYYGIDLTGAQLPFNFQLIGAEWKAATLDRMIREYEAAIPHGGWPNWVLGNHDQPRVASRLGSAQARVAMMLLLTLRGTPTLYYGDELGMTDVPIPPERRQDPFEPVFAGMSNRDPQRTPMPWNASAHAGFSSVEPWLPLGADWPERNVATELDDPGSLLTLTHRLLALRREEPALALGDYRPLVVSGEVLVYERLLQDHRFLVALNLGHEPHRISMDDAVGGGAVLLSTHMNREGELVTDGFELRPDEGLVVRLGG